jgi:hypothetical protein
MSKTKLHHSNSIEELDNLLPDKGGQSRDVVLLNQNDILARECRSLIQEKTPPIRQIYQPHLSAELADLLAPFHADQTITDWHNPIAQMVNSLQPATNSLQESTTSDNKPIRALIAYADDEENPGYQQDNKRYRDRIKKSLRTVSRQKKRKIEPTEHEIAREDTWKYGDELETAHLILLLLDHNFVDTDYCYSERLQIAVEKHHGDQIRVLPIYLRRCSIESVPFERLRFFPPYPTSVNEQDEDLAFDTIMEGIKEAVEWLVNNLRALK